ncbi:MAG: hypothetical protein KIS66_01725 [Fimbriimonadaceae bacterium]|nr:hypothetical protein [Fimbriimonadaceae bacterium]
MSRARFLLWMLLGLAALGSVGLALQRAERERKPCCAVAGDPVPPAMPSRANAQG